jgi:hypothetical protein
MSVFIVAALLVIAAMSTLSRQGQCLTAEEIVYLKKAGVSEETIQRMIQQESAQGEESQTGIQDVEDERGNQSTIYRVGGGCEDSARQQIEQEKVDRAWEMLRNLVIDARDHK